MNGEEEEKITHLENEDKFTVNGIEYEIRFSAKKMKISTGYWVRTEERKDDSPVELTGWNDVGKGFMYFCPEDQDSFSSPCVFFFDMDHTIIKPKSGGKFPENASDWIWWDKKVPETLKKLHENGARIIFISNQKSMETDKTLKEEFQEKIAQIQDKLGFLFEVCVASGSGMFRKPSPGIFFFLKEFIRLDPRSCVMVGDAAGRPANKISGRKKDFSASDRLFALNCGIDFRTPEEFFLDRPAEEFQIKEHATAKLKDNSAKFQKNVDILNSHLSEKQSLVIFTGYPGCGKSSFAKQVKKSHPEIEILCRDDVGSTDKCLRLCKEALQAKKSVVIDATNPDVASRQRYLKLAHEQNLEAIISVLFDVEIELAMHNCRYRAVTGGAVIKDMILYSHRKKFVAPARNEGFTEIISIPFEPKFRVDYRRDELVISLKHRINDAFVNMGFGEIPTSRMLLLSRGPESTIFEPDWKLIWDFTCKGPEPFEIVVCNLDVVDELLRSAQLQVGYAGQNFQSKRDDKTFINSSLPVSKKQVIDKNAELLITPSKSFILTHNSQTLCDLSPQRLAKMPGHIYIQPKPSLIDGKAVKKIPSLSPINGKNISCGDLKSPLFPSPIAQSIYSSKKTKRKLTCIQPKSTPNPKLDPKLPPRWQPKSESDSFNICIASPPITVKSKRKTIQEVNVVADNRTKRVKILDKNIVPDSQFNPRKQAQITESTRHAKLRYLAGSGDQLFFPTPQINEEAIKAQYPKKYELSRKSKVPVAAPQTKPLPTLEQLENYKYTSVATNKPSTYTKADGPEIEPKKVIQKLIFPQNPLPLTPNTPDKNC
ncbi:Oidioi.mRNA.OKI2018_I69.XSR.g16517.t1.cds [Oikopleura dioica]|uniref:Oidioi.mRNA.OKI2018_I69.XSR.g16517.t1.cds n=1 Tax=Oikopleura dioica TaxID=34765 RepID=A0ABN7SKA5_OIKDI|nr:Oidioi.mRNA.OKI2018_I69.XSR.g16517.t1.cds [Oikopleura dioica]